jgi:glutamine cyclotransferase
MVHVYFQRNTTPHSTIRHTRLTKYAIFVFCVFWLTACTTAPPTLAPAYTYRLVNTYPHDPEAFTQGLIWHNGTLYEGTGLYGASSLRQVALENGEVQMITPLPDDLFGEGITILDDQLFQLTWRGQVARVYDPNTFEQIATIPYPTEGWGLTHNGEHLIMSDGTSQLYFRDPATFAEVRRIEVLEGETPVTRLNELEFIDGYIYANVWKTDQIAIIDPEDGAVKSWIDLSGLLPSSQRRSSEAVLNGIAYDSETDRLFVTGKLWPNLFEIELVPSSPTP